MLCDECRTRMVKLDRRQEMAELEEDVTEGQMADYLAAELSGDLGNWGLGIVEYKCGKCGYRLELINNSLKNYNDLIINWHKKAMKGDYFSKYIFEYLAFNAYIKSIFLDTKGDRNAIQRLKRDGELKNQYLDRINKDTIFDLKNIWKALIKELKREPLHNSSRDYDYPEIDIWWNISGDNVKEESKCEKGVIYSLKDWVNMVEFWYGVRNNLFHSGKDPAVKRDLFIVKHAFKTLNAFMKIAMKNLA